jgi:hypothetical protein
MKNRIEAAFTGDDIVIPKPLFGFAMAGSHEKTNTQLRQMIRNDRRLDSPLQNFDSSLQNALREHCNVTGKDYNLMLKKAMDGYQFLCNENGELNLIIERIESGHQDIAAWDAKWVGPPPLVVSGKNLNHTIPVTPARICLVANPDQYDIDIREAFETVIGLPWEDVAYANPFYIVARTISEDGDRSVHYPVSILNDVMAVALNLKPLHNSWE